MRMLCAVLAAASLVGAHATAARAATTAETCAGATAEDALGRARATFHASVRPPYVVYTIARRESVNGMFDFLNTYQMRVWYRSSDGAALLRRMYGDRATGALVFDHPRFNAALDPGPPTADIFEPAPPHVATAASVSHAALPPLPEIGTLQARVESEYRPRIVGCDRKAIHLVLVARRDPDRNRLRELWLTPSTFAVQRFIANDRLYRGETDIWDPDVADGLMKDDAGLPVITSLHMQADIAEGREAADYRFRDVAFPLTLPAWYFDPTTYRQHYAEAPDL